MNNIISLSVEQKEAIKEIIIRWHEQDVETGVVCQELYQAGNINSKTVSVHSDIYKARVESIDRIVSGEGKNQ